MKTLSLAAIRRLVAQLDKTAPVEERLDKLESLLYSLTAEFVDVSNKYYETRRHFRKLLKSMAEEREKR